MRVTGTLTVYIYTLAIYCLPSGRYKVFYSHCRDSLSMGHPFGTCTLIEIDSLMDLVQHFQKKKHKHLILMRLLIKGVKITKMQSNSGSIVHYMLKTKILDHTVRALK